MLLVLALSAYRPPGEKIAEKMNRKLYPKRRLWIRVPREIRHWDLSYLHPFLRELKYNGLPTRCRSEGILVLEFIY